MNDFEKSITLINETITAQRKFGDKAGLRDSLLALGTRYLDKGDAPKALTQFEEALKLAEELDDKLTAARLWGVKGVSLVRIGNLKQALQAFNKSRKLAESIQHTPITIDAYTQIGKIQFEGGEIEKGIKNLEKAYRTAFESKDLQREMYIAGVMGNAFIALEQSGKAMEFYSIALEAAKKLDNLEGQSQYNISIGQIYLQKEDYGPAEEHFKRTLDIGTRLKNQHIVFSAFESLFHLSIQVGDTGMANFNGEQAIRLAREIEDIGAEAENIRELLQLLFDQSNYDKALSYLERGLELAELAHDKNWQMDMIAHQGLAHYFKGELKLAEEKLLEAYQLATQMQKPVELAQIGGRLSVVKADLGEFEEALKYGEEAILVAQVQELPELEGEQLMLQSMTLAEIGNMMKAKEYLQRAIELYRKMDQPHLLENAEALLAQWNAE